jgi:hypothetical protein
MKRWKEKWKRNDEVFQGSSPKILNCIEKATYNSVIIN